MLTPAELRPLFLLDPEVAFLNHGSFGACPRPVFEAYQHWQRVLEHQPLKFLGREVPALMAQARTALANYVGCDADELVYFPNPTTAINMVARSLNLRPGEEVLATDHEYGAMDRTWKFFCQKSGAHYRRQTIPLPLTTAADFVEAFWAGVTPHTRVIFISHLTSATALIFPVQAICQRARAAGILTIVDGAHAPGQLPLNLHELGADFYTGANHKWLCAPKGSAFLYARRAQQSWLEPLVVSWGWEAEKPSSSRFIDHHEYQGTHDPAAYLATPTAIEFQAKYQWDKVRAACHALVAETRQRINALTGLAPLCPESTEWLGQLATMRLPPVDVNVLKARLYDEFLVEVVVGLWQDQPMLRVAIQGYNTADDVERLLAALNHLLPQLRAG